jgi:hypothetical protein
MNSIYLWYSSCLLYPWVHELGHATIGVFFGSRLLQLNYDSVVTTHASPIELFYQNTWDFFGVGLFFACLVLWMLLEIEEARNIRKDPSLTRQDRRTINKRKRKERHIFTIMLIVPLAFTMFAYFF